MSTFIDERVGTAYCCAMRKDDVIKHYGSQINVARALDVYRQTVNQWPEIIPEKHAMRLERLTDGALEYDEGMYR